MRQCLHSEHSERRTGLPKRERIKIKYSDLKIQTLALIAAITEEDGLIDYSIYPNAINTESFHAFITQLTDKLGGGDYALFLDNLSEHKTKIAKHLFEKLTSQRSSTYLNARNSMESKATSHNLRPHTRNHCCSM